MTRASNEINIDFEYDIRASQKQMYAHNLDKEFIFYGGAVGGGKSWWLARHNAWHCMHYPYTMTMLGRHKKVDIRKTILKAHMDVVPPDLYTWLESKFIVKWINGSETHFIGADSEESLQGPSISLFGWDEAAELPYYAFSQMAARLRIVLPHGPMKGVRPRYQGLFTANPGPGWIKKLIYDRYMMGTLPDNIAFVQALPTDNPNLPAGYVDRLRDLHPDSWVRRFVEGDWSAFEGQIYEEFNPNVHVIQPFEIPVGWKRWRAMDWGYRNPTAFLWWTMDPATGRLYCYDEHYQSNMEPRQHAAYVHSKYPDEVYEYNVGDPSITKQVYGRESVLSQFQEQGIPIRLGHNERMPGIMRCKEHLELDKQGNANVYFFNHCKNTIKEIMNYRWAELDSSGLKSNKEEPVQVNDHACDAFRYFIMSRPRRPKMRRMPEFGTIEYMDMVSGQQENYDLMGWDDMEDDGYAFS